MQRFFHVIVAKYAMQVFLKEKPIGQPCALESLSIQMLVLVEGWVSKAVMVEQPKHVLRALKTGQDPECFLLLNT
jgi:hypothetical protein